MGDIGRWIEERMQRESEQECRDRVRDAAGTGDVEQMPDRAATQI
jgi:hypothetical protein